MPDHEPTQTATAALPPNKSRANPVQIFVDRDRTAFLWFCVAGIAVVVALIQPHYIANQLKQRERVVIIDPAGTFYVSPLLEFQEAKEFHAQQSTLATLALLERNPNGFDHRNLLGQMYLKGALKKAQIQIATERDEFKAKQLHQKPEIGKIDILETRESFVMSQVTGQLIRTGVFDGKAFSEAIPFKLAFKMVRNPDMVKNGRFPTAVHDFRYEPTR